MALFPVLQVFWWNNIASPVKIPGNAISETLNFKMSLDALALKNLCLDASSKDAYTVLFITSLLLENFLTALL